MSNDSRAVFAAHYEKEAGAAFDAHDVDADALDMAVDAGIKNVQMARDKCDYQTAKKLFLSANPDLVAAYMAPVSPRRAQGGA